jgi:hypothetical protein
MSGRYQAQPDPRVNHDGWWVIDDYHFLFEGIPTAEAANKIVSELRLAFMHGYGKALDEMREKKS